MSNLSEVKGIVCPMVTPFDEKGNIDSRRITSLVSHLYTGGVRYLLPAGTTGEGMLLSFEERMQLTEAVLESAEGKCKVIVHTGCASTKETVALTEHAKASGAFAASIIAPFFYTYSQSELIDHYSEIARRVDGFPLLLYSFPGNAKNPITTQTVRKLLDAYPEYIGIKLSDINLIQFQEYVVAGGPSFNVLCGVDALMLPALSVGSKGQVSGNANVFPEVFCELNSAYSAGDMEKAQLLQRKINAIRAILKDNIAYFKAALRIMDLDVGRTRAPIHWLDASEFETLKENLAGLQ